MTDNKELHNRSYASDRIQTLTDGIYAIAMTLLVLNIDIPDPPQTAQTFQIELLTKYSVFWHYIIGFLVLATFWSVHHKQYQRILRVTKKVLWVNFLSLLFIVLIPFSVSLLTEYDYIPAAAVIFHLNIFIIGLTFYVNWICATKNLDHIHESVKAEDIRMGKQRCLVVPFIALIGIGISFLSPRWSSSVYLLISMIMSIQKRINKKLDKKENYG